MSSPWNHFLPKCVEICGQEYPVRSDYRAILDICTALSDPELSEQERAAVVLSIFYPEFEEMPAEHYEEAIRRCFWFINCGNEDDGDRKIPKLVDWEQDFPYIVSPVNRVMGREIREAEYLHWWSFISAYYEIGDCLFAQIVRIRSQLAKGRPLDKSDQAWYRENRYLVDMKNRYSARDNETVAQWCGAEAR